MFSLYNPTISLLVKNIPDQAVGISSSFNKFQLKFPLAFSRQYRFCFPKRSDLPCAFYLLSGSSRFNRGSIVPALCRLVILPGSSFYKYLLRQFRFFLNPPLLFSILSGRVLRHFMKFMFFRHKQTQTKFYRRVTQQRELSFFLGGLDLLRGAVSGFTDWYLFRLAPALFYSFGILNYQQDQKISIVQLANSFAHFERLSAELLDSRLANSVQQPTEAVDPFLVRYQRLANNLLCRFTAAVSPSFNVRYIGGTIENKKYSVGSVGYGRSKKRKVQTRWGRLFLLTKKTSKVSRMTALAKSPNLMSLTLRHLVLNRSLWAFSLLPVPLSFFINLLANNSLIWYNLLSELFTYFRGRR